MLNLLAQALVLGENISEHMQKGDWPQVDHLQRQQRGLLEQLDSIEVPADVAEQTKIKQLSLAIQALTEQQLKISHARKYKLLTEIKMSNRSKQMNNAYNQNS